MIIAWMAGGLGNQMFEYAAARALAARHGAELRLDLSHYVGEQRPAEFRQFPRAFQLDRFLTCFQPASDQDVGRVRDRWRDNRLVRGLSLRLGRLMPQWCAGYYAERSLSFDPNVLKLPDDTYLWGYWQSERYFKAHEALIRKEFTFRDPSLGQYAADYVAGRRRPGSAVVSVHIRRGDMAHAAETLKNAKLVYGPAVSLDYIREGMRQFEPGSTFLVFSDSSADLDWCKAQLADGAAACSGNLHFCYGHTDLQDFAIMQACDHHVIANSTFSWWAAWLNPNPCKVVIAPRRWFHPDQHPGHRMESLIPDGWRLL